MLDASGRGSALKDVALRTTWRVPLIRALTSCRPVIVLYHDVPALPDGTSLDGETFERQIRFLTQHFEVVSPHETPRDRRALDPIRVLITFDDGFRNNFDVAAPILRKYRVPAMFFVCSRHAEPGNYLWFSYLRAIERHFPGNGFVFRGEFMDMTPPQRARTVQRLRERLLGLTPHPAAMYAAIDDELPRLDEFVSREEIDDRYAGMSEDQLKRLAADPLFRLGVHTADHPFLTRCTPAEMDRQIQSNRTWLERVVPGRYDAIAYPSGDYDATVLDRCGDMGFSEGYALTPLVKGRRDLQRPRIGIYSPSLDVLGLKVQWGNAMRALRLSVG